MGVKEDETAKVNAIGDKIRELKKAKAAKEVVMAEVEKLKSAKEAYEKAVGEPFPAPAPAPAKKKKAVGPPSQPKSREGVPAGMSKNEAKKAAKKAAAAAKKAEYKSGNVPAKDKSAKPDAGSKTAAVAKPAAAGKSAAAGLEIKWCEAPGAAPSVSMLAKELAGAKSVTFTKVNGQSIDVQLGGFQPTIPTLVFPNGESLSGDLSIARYIAREYSKTLYGADSLSASLVDQWLEYLQHAALRCGSPEEYESIVQILEQSLATKTFLVGTTMTLADLVAWSILQGNGISPSSGNAKRWYGACNAVGAFQTVNTQLLGGNPAPAAQGGGDARKTGVSSGTFVELPHVEDVGGPTKVVTRFPPEPSGFLHIGHAKASMLNNYFAHEQYQGKLLLRFDDTNPSKEKEEFTEAILKDLQTLGIKPDKIVYTSDNFKLIESYLEKLLDSGDAYVDNTDVETMREERWNGIESKCRKHTPAENKALWAEMKKGTKAGQECVVRMRMDMSNPNKCLRDPGLYRVNLTPHARTGTKFKVYPTYDFACPIVDAHDGVTHALRDRQYIDRDPMFEYFQKVMGLRKVYIWEFSRLNFKQCVLSKRKIQWFVDEGYVKGWDDPRVPTIQGITRRGLTVEALKLYILSQGSSKNVTNQSWDKIWTVNKKIIDPIVPRFTALASEKAVRVTITDGPKEVEFKRMPKHQKNPELGNKVTRFYKNVFIEAEDANTLDPKGEEVTLMAWGNVILGGRSKSGFSGKLNPEGDKKKTKKLTWLADVNDLVPVTLVTLDHLVNEDFDDNTGDSAAEFATFVKDPAKTWIETAALADPNVRTVKKGEIVQFERKGFYICDKPFTSAAAPAVFFLIPDGRQSKAQAAKTTANKAASKAAKDAKSGKEAKPAAPTKPKVKGTKPVPAKGEKFYLTTAINYTNGSPHMGHAYEAITSDVICRYHRAYGRDVYFLTGTDEHGQKIADTAAKCDPPVRPIDICDKYVAEFQALNKSLSVSNDGYIRTTNPDHEKVTQQLWKRCLDKGDIYLDRYSGYYNVKEETFVTESEAEQSGFKDPTTGAPLEKREEESYFFRMSKYHEPLVAHINANKGFIQPEKRRNAILSRLKEPLRDLSISRNTFEWGVPVPDGGKHVMYVWFDALTNYLSAVGFPELGLKAACGNADGKGLWPADCHIIGQDILWFHTVIWPTMLMSAGVPLPKTVYGHGFVNDQNGEKMSKSVGNVVDPIEQIKKYGSDSLRFFLIRSCPYGNDLPYSEAALQDLHNADLADTLGNLVNRGLNLCKKYCDSVIPDVPTDEPFDLWHTLNRMEEHMAAYKLDYGMYAAVAAAHDCNKYLADMEPWKMKEGQETKRATVVRSALEGCLILAHLLSPVIPEACATILEKLNFKQVPLTDLSEKFDNFTAGHKVAANCILFQKFDKDGDGAVAHKAKDKGKAGGKGGGGKGGGGKGGKGAATAAGSSEPDTVIDLANDACIGAVDIRVGMMSNARKHDSSDKLFVEDIDIGPDGKRQVCSGLYQHLSPEEMSGLCCVVVNLKKAKMGGVESNGMVLCASGGGTFELLRPPEGSIPGERVSFEGITRCKAAAPNAMAKKKIMPGITGTGDLKTTDAKQASWRGHVMMTSAGPVTVKSIAGGGIS
eukprot:COSAG02_NODE_2366_length_9052_cov_1.784541_4_plen_1632_part_00